MLDADQVAKSRFFMPQLVRNGFESSSIQTAVAFWTPASGKRVIVTDLIISAAGAGIVTIFEGTDAVANWLFKAESSATAQWIHVPFNPAWVAAINAILRFTTTTTTPTRVIARGFESSQA